MEAYWRKDPADVSLNAICHLAEVSKPALYRVFGNEDGLMRAVLDRYAARVLSSIFDLLSRTPPLPEALEALIAFASQDPKMETGCVFFKMRAGKHRLGPRTLERVQEIDAAAVQALAAYLDGQRQSGHWDSDHSATIMARYLVEQIGLALMQRASGEDPAQVRDMLVLAFSALTRP